MIADVLPRDKAGVVKDMQGRATTSPWSATASTTRPGSQADVGIAIGAGTDVAIETAYVVLMHSEPLDVATAVTIGRGTVRKMKQNLAWAIGYNSIALPIAGPASSPHGDSPFGPRSPRSQRPAPAFSLLKAVALKRLKLP